MMPEEPVWDVLVKLDHTGELLWCGGFGQPSYWLHDEAVSAWREAQAAARDAYADWCRNPGPDAYAAYLAAQDQADSALGLLQERAITDAR